MESSALRRFVEHLYKMLSRQQLTIESLRKELAETGFETERVYSSTLLWQVAYGIALKLVLYSLIERRFGLPSLSELSAGELADAFREAYAASKLAALEQSWVDDGLSLVDTYSLQQPLQDAIEVIKAHKASDRLGQLYEELMPPEERRRLGEFYTPRPIAEFMVGWAVRGRGDYVLDPCVGSGTFLMEAFHTLKALSAEVSHGLPNQLYGVDINPLAVLMTTINILNLVPGASPKIYMADFLKLNHKAMCELGFERTDFDAIVCNPPYTRHHDLLPSYKEEIARMIEAETGWPISRLSSIYIHFFIHAYQFLRDGGRLAFITPSEWMETDYGAILRRFLAEKVRVDSIILFGEDMLAFPNALTRACITLAYKEAPGGYTSLIELRSWPPVIELAEAVEAGVERDYGWGRVKLRRLTDIDPHIKWTPLFREDAKRTLPHFITKLGSLASISRGIATGANEFFTLSEEEVRRYGIERKYLKPVVIGARYLKGYDFTESDLESLKREGKKVYLLWCFKRKEELRGTSILKYIEMGEKKSFDKRFLTRHRPVWYWVESRRPPDAFLVYMFRRRMRFVYNAVGAYALNTLHCVYFNEEVREERDVKAVLAYLNSRPAFELARTFLRVYGGGMYKLEPREAVEIPCINPHKLKINWREKLASLFDELCETSRANKTKEEEVLQEIDKEVARLLTLL
jgi:tRNA1(Val) A37 N6-methylase TrmN6